MTTTMTHRPPRSATRELLGLHTREFLRDHRNSWFAFLFPLAMSALFFGIAETVPPASDPAIMGFGDLVVPMALFFAVTTTPLSATSGPLITLRTQGTLRLLGTTPAGRARFLLTHMPVRLGVVLAQLIVLLTAGVVLGYVAPADLPTLFGAALLGLMMFGALGYLLGGVMPGADSATHVGTFVQVGSLLLCMVALPTGMLPAGVHTVVSHLPPTYFVDLLLATTPYWEPLHPTWQSVVVVLGTAVALTACAVSLFRWDQGEHG